MRDGGARSRHLGGRRAVPPFLQLFVPQNVLAKMVIERVPSVEMVRFVNSGTEACLSVVRLMRAYTGREKASAARAACQRQSVP